MKRIALKLGIPLIVTLILSFMVYLVFRSIINSAWVFLVAFASLLHIVFFSLYVVEEDGIAWRLIVLFSGWSAFIVEPFIEKEWSVIFALLFFGGIVIAPIVICFMFSVVLSLIISPIAYVIYCCRG